MRSKQLTLTGSGSGTTNTSPLRLNSRAPGYTFSFNTDGSTTGFSVQVTLTNPEEYASSSAWATAANWKAVDNMSGVTADVDQAVISPVQGVRLQADANGTDIGVLDIIERDD